jgi:hypothetical protein
MLSRRIVIGGVAYVRSRDAAHGNQPRVTYVSSASRHQWTPHAHDPRGRRFSGWSQDYITILCRKGTLRAVQTKASWFVDEEALLAYVKEAAEKTRRHSNTGSLLYDSIMIDGRSMISTRAAAKIARCTQDYITVLSRQGKILAAQHSNQWSIDERSLRHYLLDTARRKQELRARIREERRAIRRLHEELAGTEPRRP